jgi:predicted DNA-binding transcriptional regulator AlpA
MGTAHSGNEVTQKRLRDKWEGEEQHRVYLEALLNECDVARITGLSVASVRRWRLLRQGPRFLKLNSAVRYRAEDVAAWLESRPTGGGHQETR